MPERFLIYNASAGAGKTYQLVRNYLGIILASKDPLRFMQILAMTFTNKAAKEMKHRLLSQLAVLKQYPQEDKESRDYTVSFARELGIEPEDLKYRAAAAQSGILHHYAAFGVSTIDSFTNRLIRSFSKDLDLNGTYAVEMDTDRMLNEAIDRVFEALRADDPYTEVLSRFIERQLELEKSNNSRSLLQEKSKELFKERAFPFLERLAEIDIESLLKQEIVLKGKRKVHLKAIVNAADGFLEEVEKQGLTVKSFHSSGLAPWIEKLRNGDIKAPTEAKRRHHEAGPEKVVTVAGKKQSILGEAHWQEYFHQKQEELLLSFQSHFEPYFIIERLLDSIYPLSLLSIIERELEAVKEETGRLPIGDFNKLISRELRQQPAAFLYERMGDRYDDFFIDEFQDTSRLQWENLLPLINNAMASEGSSTMIVGDAKQSIYRFRGGDLQLFVDLFKDKDPSNKTSAGELYRRKLIQMTQNWRSRAGLVEFNNAFFASLSKHLPNPEYQEIYAQGAQEPARDPGGRVVLELIAKESTLEDENQILIDHLNDLLQRGFRQRDICILGRSNENCTKAAAMLLDREADLQLPEGEHLQILSVDSLVVGASQEVRALISFLQTVENPANREQRKDWIALAFRKFAKEGEDPHEFRRTLARAEMSEIWQLLQEWVPQWNAEEWLAQDLVERCYQWLRYFDLNWQQDPYLQFFLDQVSEYLERQRPVSQEFLDWWQDKGREKSVGIPESTNAIQIMTIHKSKGLEFPVVICLSADGALDSAGSFTPGIWKELDSEQFVLDFSFIELKKPEDPFSQPVYNQWYEEEMSRVMMDNLNVYYVAFTRAEQELIILSKEPPSKPSKLYLEMALAAHFSASEPGTYSIGEPIIPKVSKLEEPGYTLNTFSPVPWQERLEMLSNVPKHWQHDRLKEARKGSLMHALLAQLKHPQDLTKILNQAASEAWLSKDEEESLARDLDSILSDSKLTALFHPQAKVYNERSILLPQGGRKVPDRLVQYQGKWYLADYKTGQALSTHHDQLQEYAYLLAQSGMPIEQAFIIYLGDKQQVEEVPINRLF